MKKSKNEKVQKVIEIAREDGIPCILRSFPIIWGMTQEKFYHEFYEKTHCDIKPIITHPTRNFPIDDNELREQLQPVIEEIFDEYKNSSKLTDEKQEYINEHQEHIEAANANLFGHINLYYKIYDWACHTDKIMNAVLPEENTARMIYNYISNQCHDYDIKHHVVQSMKKYPYSKIYN